MEKVQWNSIKKTKMDLNNRKMTNHPPSPEKYIINKHNMVLHYKIWKMNENKENKMYLIIEKWQIIHPPRQ